VSNTCSAPQCDRPAHDGHLCVNCLATLRRDLKAIPELLTDLEITISKQDKLTDSEKRASSERPLPLRLGPMEAKRDLADTLRFWSYYLTRKTGYSWLQMPGVNPGLYAAYLTDSLTDIQVDPQAGSLADEIGYAVVTAQRAVDKPLQHVYAGPCDKCTTDLYAHPRAKEAACRNVDCDAVYDIEARRTWLLEQAEGQLLTATEMSRALPGLLQKPLTAATIRGLAHRGRLTQHPADPRRPRDPLYRVGEVIDLLTSIEEESARQKAS
jgi:hypothetical protein